MIWLKNQFKKYLSSSASFSNEASRMTLINENWSSIPGHTFKGQVSEDEKEADFSL